MMEARICECNFHCNKPKELTVNVNINSGEINVDKLIKRLTEQLKSSLSNI